MGLKAFTSDGVIRAGFGYAGTFSSSYCKRFYPATYRISGINFLQGYIRNPPWNNNPNIDYTKSPYTVLYYSFNNTIFTNVSVAVNNQPCLELTQLSWGFHYNGWSYAIQYNSSAWGLGQNLAYLNIPLNTWVLRANISSTQLILAYAPGSKWSPPRSNWIIPEFHINNNNSGSFARGVLSLK